jgi:hypothetical protein
LRIRVEARAQRAPIAFFFQAFLQSGFSLLHCLHRQNRRSEPVLLVTYDQCVVTGDESVVTGDDAVTRDQKFGHR